MYACPSVCHKHCFFFFVSRWNRSICWSSVLHDKNYKTLFFDLRFRPPNAQNLLPKICTKSPITRLVRQTDRRCLGLPGGFRGWPIQWNHAKCCGLTLVAMATKFRLGAEIQSPTGLLLVLVCKQSGNTYAITVCCNNYKCTTDTERVCATDGCYTSCVHLRSTS